MEDALEFFSRAPTTAIADASIFLGLDLIMKDVAPLTPFTEERVAAPAATMRFEPVRGEVNPSRVSLYGTHEEMEPGKFVVLATEASDMAVLGANGARVIHRRGAAGVVTDGRARDVLEIRELGLPVWCCGARPLPYSRRLIARSATYPSPAAGCGSRRGTSSSPMRTAWPWCRRPKPKRCANEPESSWKSRRNSPEGSTRANRAPISSR